MNTRRAAATKDMGRRLSISYTDLGVSLIGEKGEVGHSIVRRIRGLRPHKAAASKTADSTPQKKKSQGREQPRTRGLKRSPWQRNHDPLCMSEKTQGKRESCHALASSSNLFKHEPNLELLARKREAVGTPSIHNINRVGDESAGVDLPAEKWRQKGS